MGLLIAKSNLQKENYFTFEFISCPILLWFTKKLTKTIENTPIVHFIKQLDTKIEKIMREANADIKAEKNISKAYDNVDDFFSDLGKDAWKS